jgi:hypothetical protein
VFVKALKRRPSGLLGDRATKAQEGRSREAGSTTCGALWRGGKTQESIGPAGLRTGIGIRILAGRKALKLRGIVIFWSSEQKSAMSETA